MTAEAKRSVLPCEMIANVRYELQLAMANLELLIDHRLENERLATYADKVRMNIRAASEKLSGCLYIKGE